MDRVWCDSWPPIGFFAGLDIKKPRGPCGILEGSFRGPGDGLSVEIFDEPGYPIPASQFGHFVEK